MPVPGSDATPMPGGTTAASITGYVATGPTIPPAVAGIKITHALMKTETQFNVIPPQLHRILDDGVPLLMFGRQGYVESMKVNLTQMHADLQCRDIVTYIRPVNPLTAIPGVFLQRTCSIMARTEKLRTNTIQVVVTEEGAIADGDDLPFPIVAWFLKQATVDIDPKGVLLVGDWPTLAGHLHNLIADPPEVVLAHSGGQSTPDVKAKILSCTADAIPMQLSAALQSDVSRCVSTGVATWVPLEAEDWRKDQEEHEALKRKTKAEAQRDREAAKAAAAAAAAKPPAKPTAPKKSRKPKPSAAPEDTAAPAAVSPSPALPTPPNPEPYYPTSEEEAEEEEDDEASDLEVSQLTHRAHPQQHSAQRPLGH